MKGWYDKELAARAHYHGATSGIGVPQRALRRAGARVCAIGRDEGRLGLVVEEMQTITGGGEAFGIVADVTDEQAAASIVARTVERCGALDVLVNAAGHLTTGTIETTPLSAWDAMLNVNLRAVFNLMQQAVPHLEARRGNIVNVSSVTGLRAFPGGGLLRTRRLDQLTRAPPELAPGA